MFACDEGVFAAPSDATRGKKGATWMGCARAPATNRDTPAMPEMKRRNGGCELKFEHAPERLQSVKLH